MPPRAKPGAPCSRCGGKRQRADTRYCNACKARARLNTELKYNFGITVERYEEMLADQGGVCAICRRRPGKRRLAVDHDHACCPQAGRSCGKCVRGLLCKTCNYQLLGNICQENAKGREHALEALERAVMYLERRPDDQQGTGTLRCRSQPRPRGRVEATTLPLSPGQAGKCKRKSRQECVQLSRLRREGRCNLPANGPRKDGL